MKMTVVVIIMMMVLNFSSVAVSSLTRFPLDLHINVIQLNGARQALGHAKLVVV